MRNQTQKHTPEPWFSEPTEGSDKSGDILIGGAAGELIAVCKSLLGDRPVEDNAERIVACVNACEGIADPSCVPELLAALKACDERMTELQKMTDYPLAWPRVLARAAIAKAEGKQ